MRKLLYRDMILSILLLVILLYLYFLTFVYNYNSIFYMLYSICSYIILIYYILISSIFYYFSDIVIEMFSNIKTREVELSYDELHHEYYIRFSNSFYWFKLDYLYSSYLYRCYRSDKIIEELDIIESLLKECDKQYGKERHFIYEMRYYKRSYTLIILLTIIYFIFLTIKNLSY